MEPRSNIEKPKDRKVKRQKNQKIEDMEIIEIKKEKQTPNKYPRKAGLPSKEPIE